MLRSYQLGGVVLIMAGPVVVTIVAGQGLAAVVEKHDSAQPI
jgi:hypothetical protein